METYVDFHRDKIFGHLGLHLLVGRSCPFHPIIDPRMQWLWTLNLVCEVPLSLRCLGPLHTRSKSHDHEIVRAQKNVSKDRPKTPPKSCSVVMGYQV